MQALHYDPNAEYEVEVKDIEYRREGDLSLMASVYIPQGEGPFPLLIDLHGGGWRLYGRQRQASIASDLAAHGIVVASLDFRAAPPTEKFPRVDGPHAPYPAIFQDVNYGIRYFKHHAAEYGASAAVVGAIGFSSGGHLAFISAVRGQDPEFAAIPLEEGPEVTADLDYMICSGMPVDMIECMVSANVVKTTVPELEPFVDEPDFFGIHDFFGGIRKVKENSPLHIVAEAEGPLNLPPMLVIQGDADFFGGLTTECTVEFVRVYARAGGVVELAVYPGAPHIFVNREVAGDSENQRRGMAGIAGYIQRQLAYLADPAPAGADTKSVMRGGDTSEDAVATPLS